MQDRKPMILVFAGPNGSGKSTITQYFDTVGIYTNADDIVKSTGMSNEDAAHFVDSERYKSIEKREDFTFETVLSSKYKLDILQKAKTSGYFIKCIFVLTNDPDVNINRVETRVVSGGHNVDKDKIKSRYYKSLDNVKKLIDLCDIMHIYDNSGAEPIRIVRKHKDEDIRIYTAEYWDYDSICRLIGYDE